MKTADYTRDPSTYESTNRAQAIELEGEHL